MRAISTWTLMKQRMSDIWQSKSQSDRIEHTKVIFEPCPRETVLYPLDRMWHSSCLRAVVL